MLPPGLCSPVDPALQAALGLLTGLVAGLAAGLFGVGGGIVLVPVLHYGLRLPFVLSTQISLLVIALNTPFGLLRQHRRHGTVRWREGLLLTAGGAVGVAAAIALRPFVPVTALKVLFALVGVFAAYRLLRPLEVRRHGSSRWVLALAGVAGGMAAHWLGIGGGLIMVPALVFLGLGIHEAVATSLVAVFTNAAVSTLWDLPVLVHHLADALPLVAGALAGVGLGVHYANRTAALRLRRLFAIFLLTMALYVLVDTIAPLAGSAPLP